MNWFATIAPIRLKLLIAFGAMAGLTAIMALAAILLGAHGPTMTAIGVGTTAAACAFGYWARKAIADPYVATVVRMEGLAAGDLDSPIAHIDYRDCVGRLTKAMFTFRDAAAEQIRQTEAQKQVVRVLADHLSELAQGNLTAEVTADFPTDYRELKDNFNEALASLRKLIGSVSDKVTVIQSGSTEIAQASEDLARRTESSAASLEQTSAALVQIDGRLKNSAEAARSTVGRADQAIATVGSGRVIADNAVKAMERVSDSAKGIDSVIEGLDKIAFQTRVLAMNAAVEAGRAGDAGRGFAVVADLVSALAMRSEEEAKSARDQLTVTQSDIGTAVEAVHRVDSALQAISGDVTEVHSLLGTMASDNAVQSVAITEITAAIATMDQLTQQNAAMVEETSAAARNLTSEVGVLGQEASTFRVEQGAVGKAVRRSRAASAAFSRELMAA